MKIGLLREGKYPPDKRVPFSPKQCESIISHFESVEICVQPSEIRCFKDSEYKEVGVAVLDDLSDCDIIMGVKEVPVSMLLENKVFYFFSHTIKQQPYNRNLLKTIIAKNIQLVDYETIIDEKGKRLIGFGRYAGIVGCYNSFLTFGKKTKIYNLTYAHLLDSMDALCKELEEVQLPNDLKIILTGCGRVSNGAKEVLDMLHIKETTKEEFISNNFYEPVYVQLNTLDYNKRIDGAISSKTDFYKSPNKYKSSLKDYINQAHILIAGHFYAEGSPYILTNDDLLSHSCKIQVIGDISCDIAGPIASTIRPSTISEPIYGYNPITSLEDDYTKKNIIAVMAVDNLPCSLPKDASVDFGDVFIKDILPDLINRGPIMSNASITLNGFLTDRFKYLSEYIN